VAWALNQGVIVVAGLPEMLGDGGGAGELNGVVGVQAVDEAGQTISAGRPLLLRKVSVAAPGVGVLLQGNWAAHDWTPTRVGKGTSYAAPITAGVLAATWSAWPDATGNQVLQSLVRNTGAGNPRMVQTDELGYGVVNLQNMLADDPTRYPDVNPLVVEEARFEDDLSAAEIAAATTPDALDPSRQGSQPTRADTSSGSVAPGESQPGNPFVLILTVCGVIVAIVLVLVVVLVRRSRKEGVSR
jgi:hypothetical protein